MIGQNHDCMFKTTRPSSRHFASRLSSPPFAAAAATAREHVPRRAVVLRLQSQARRTSRASRWCVSDSFSLDRHGLGSHDDGFRRSRAITRARASRDARVALYAIRSIDSHAVAREREGRRAILEGCATDDDRCRSGRVSRRSGARCGAAREACARCGVASCVCGACVRACALWVVIERLTSRRVSRLCAQRWWRR